MSDGGATKTVQTSLGQGFDWRKVRMYRLRLRSPDGVETEQEYAKRSLRVGSRSGNDLTIADGAVSRIHFEIVADEHGYRLHDLGSSNGTFVDGARAIEVYLRSGAHIRVGRSEIVFEALVDEADVQLSRSDQFGPLVGKTDTMRELFATLGRVATSDATVLVEGETGTGKELIAQAIHVASARAGGPLAVFDAAAAPPELIESQLFGHEKGAFTGATSRRAGVLEEADGGTLFIDELGELPLALQPKLLRLLETREVRPVGSNRARKVDVRIVAATNRDLAAQVNNGQFRDDLYYRLAVVRLVVPPLRAHVQDVRPLLEHFVRKICGADERRVARIVANISQDNWRTLEVHPWPGNVRELRNVVERALALAGDAPPSRFDPHDNSYVARVESSLAPDLGRPFVEQKAAIVASFERDYLEGMLEAHSGNISRAAKAAGIDRMYFKRLLKKHRCR